MSIVSWLRRGASNRQPFGTTKRRPGLRIQPRLEVLEDRCLPSTLTVLNNLDSAPSSLRAEIAAANPGDTINFAPSLDGQTIQLTSGQLFINKSLSIQGPGAGQLAISGGNQFRVLDVYGLNTNVNVTLSGLTITQGNAGSGDGGGIYNSNGSTLTISGCTLSNNSAFSGGGVGNLGATLQIVNSTLLGNKADDSNDGGEGGAVYSDGLGDTVSMTGCTLSNNSATFEGGAVWTISTMMTIKGCPFSGNIQYGGSSHVVTGNDIYNGASASMLTISHSVFSNNTPYPFEAILGPWTNKGGNTFN